MSLLNIYFYKPLNSESMVQYHQKYFQQGNLILLIFTWKKTTNFDAKSFNIIPASGWISPSISG